MKIAQGSKSWILTALIGAFVFIVLSVIIKNDILQIIFLFISTILFLLTGFFIIFFRDPEREIADGFCAVADGKIRQINETMDDDVGKCIFISTFMNVNNVHVNRMPIDGIIKDVKHISGSHVPAFKKESDRNERLILEINSSLGVIKVVQIAGTLARRIVSYVKKGDKLKKGQRIGIIRLGSRVDVYIPVGKVKNLKVKADDRVKAGEYTIAEIND